MHQGDADVPERIGAGERVFRPGAPTEAARRLFEALVGHLRELHGRGLIDMPERSVTQTADTGGGAYLMAGPRFLPEAGRAALEELRQGDRRVGERRAGERHQTGDAGVEHERRAGERQRGDRRD